MLNEVGNVRFSVIKQSPDKIFVRIVKRTQALECFFMKMKKSVRAPFMAA